MTGAASRRKGHDFEREFCRWVRDEFGVVGFARNLKQYGAAQEGDTDPIAGFLPECKAHKAVTRGALKKWYAQAVEQAKKKGLIPLLVYKIPQQGWRAAYPDPLAWETGAEWRYQYEFAKHVEPPLLGLVIREKLGG